VQRIERSYRPRERGTSRVMLCMSRRVAGIWSLAATRREGWDRVRRSVPWMRVDHGKCPGVIGTVGDAALQHDILDAIVERWPTPAQAIDGLEEVEGGVWKLAGEPTAEATVRIGPLWLGRGRADQERPCLVGPRWLPDHAGTREEPSAGAPSRAQLRPIAQVELASVSHAAPGLRPALSYALVKRAMDIVLSASALIVAAPLLPLIAILILLEDGRPVFFGHTRQGRGGRPFVCLKFRTMHHHAHEIARQLEAYNQADGPQVFIRDDPRVTRVGRYLRKSHLDELPQLFNVLAGQMSLVGPRPSPDDENQFCPAWRDVRLSVRPGITGLWQLKRTREPGEDFQEWIRYDIEYVENASLWLDVKIMVRTAWLMVRGRPERASQ
jgi:lipopolysaccharide/colanic/teichoic acid biosynthesis glycosyltransferase